MNQNAALQEIIDLIREEETMAAALWDIAIAARRKGVSLGASSREIVYEMIDANRRIKDLLDEMLLVLGLVKRAGKEPPP